MPARSPSPRGTTSRASSPRSSCGDVTSATRPTAISSRSSSRPPSRRRPCARSRSCATASPTPTCPPRRRTGYCRSEPAVVRASPGGPLPYMRRLRTIEAETAAHAERLAEAYAEHGGDPEAWRRVAETWDFGEVNELIDRPNRWFPLESRLPMDPRSPDFVKIAGRPYPRAPLDAAWALAQL